MTSLERCKNIIEEYAMRKPEDQDHEEIVAVNAHDFMLLVSVAIGASHQLMGEAGLVDPLVLAASNRMMEAIVVAINLP